jgi:hypothetical protein
MAKAHYKFRSGLLVKGVTADPSDAEEGDLIFRSDLTPSRYRIFRSGVWADLHDSRFVHQFRTTDSASTGANASLAAPTSPFIELTNASLTSVDMIPAGQDGQVITVTNLVGADVEINDDLGGTAANRIRTGTAGAITLADNASISLIYNSSEARWFIVGGSGSGGGVKITYDLVTGQVGNTITFTKSYAFGKNAMFFRNGVKMHTVTSFTPAADEMQEVNAGPSSTQITVDAAYASEAEDIWELYYAANTFEGIGLAERTDYIARGYADGTQAQDCAITTVSNKTRVTVSGFTMELGVNAGKTLGYQKVEVNGQEIERLTAGINDNLSNVVYEEVSGTIIDVYEIGPGATTLPIDAAAEIRVSMRSYFVAELDAITSDLIPGADGMYDIGSLTRRWFDIFASNYVRIGTNGIMKFDETTQKLQFSNDNGSTFSDFGSGSGGGADLNSVLSADEADTLVTLEPNILIDDFGDEQKGTKVDVSQANSALRLNAGETSGTYERIRETTASITSIDGAVVISAQALAPKNTAMSPSSNAAAVTILFAGDVREFFPVSKNVVICKEIVSDGKLRQIFLVDPTTNVVAQLPVASTPTYNSGTDETTVVITNTELLDLDLDVSSGNYNAQLRVKPFDYQFQAKATVGGAYEDLDLIDANIYDPPTVRLPGENFFKALTGGGIQGSILNLDGKFSPNGTYGIARLWERRSDLPAHLWHWFYTTDRGANWTKFAATKTSGAYTATDEFGGVLGRCNDSQLAVANNGKLVATYLFQEGSGETSIKAVTSDLAIGSPVLTDIVAGREGNVGYVAGGSGGTSYISVVAANLVDLSWVVIGRIRSSSTVDVDFYTAGATVYSTTSSGSAPSCSFPYVTTMHVSGSGTSHRFHMFRRDSAVDGNIAYFYIDQGSTAWSSATSIQAGNNYLLASSIGLNDRLVVMYTNNSPTNVRFGTLTSTFGGAPSAVTNGTLWNNPIGGEIDFYVGNSNTTDVGINFTRYQGKNIVQNPANEKHCFFSLDIKNADNVRKPLIWEVEDITAFRGIQASQYTSSIGIGIKDAVGHTRIAQTWTASAGDRVRAVSMEVSKIGSPVGTITCDIYATSSNIPTGSPIASALNTIDASKVSASNNAIYFRFNNVALTGGVKYAYVLTASYAISASHYVRVIAIQPGAFANGDFCYDNGVWNQDTSADLKFEIIGEYVFDVANENNTLFGEAAVSGLNVVVESQQSGINLVDTNGGANTVLFTTRRHIGMGDTYRPLNGHPYRGLLTISSTPASLASVMPALNIAGYANSNSDKNLIFNVGLNLDDSAVRDTSSGVYSTTSRAEDRSPTTIPVSAYTNILAGDMITNSSYSTGKAIKFNGSNKVVAYLNSTGLQELNAGQPFAVESEFKLDSTGANTLVAKYGSGLYSWLLRTNASGGIEFFLYNPGNAQIGSCTSVNSILSTGVIYVARVTYDGTGAPKIFLSTTGPSGVFTEVSYSATLTFTGSTSGGASLTIGGIGDSGWMAGEIAYVKVIKGSSTFAYNGYKSNPAIVGVLPGGPRIFARSKGGQMSGTPNNTYGYGGIIDGQYANQAAVVDSYDSFLKFTQPLDLAGRYMYLKTTLGRGSDRNQSALQGVIYKYLK